MPNNIITPAPYDAVIEWKIDMILLNKPFSTTGTPAEASAVVTVSYYRTSGAFDRTEVKTLNNTQTNLLMEAITATASPQDLASRAGVWLDQQNLVPDSQVCPIITVDQQQIELNTIGWTGEINQPFETVYFSGRQFTATSGTSPYTFQIIQGAFPAGMSLQSNGTPVGTPTESGAFAFKLRVTDANGCTGISDDLTLTINPAA